jgi:hypothetical protein
MMDQTLNKNPSIYLAVALSGLWFPAQNVLLNAQMTALARYLRTVLTPKVNEIVRIADSRLASQHAIWEEAYFAKHVLGALSWEEFRAEVQYDRSRNLLTYAPLWVFRFVILSLPSMILTARYIEVRWVSSDVAWSKLLEIPLIIMLGILILGLLIGGYSEANVTRTHRTLSKEGRRTGR